MEPIKVQFKLSQKEFEGAVVRIVNDIYPTTVWLIRLKIGWLILSIVTIPVIFEVPTLDTFTFALVIYSITFLMLYFQRYRSKKKKKRRAEIREKFDYNSEFFVSFTDTGIVLQNGSKMEVLPYYAADKMRDLPWGISYIESQNKEKNGDHLIIIYRNMVETKQWKKLKSNINYGMM